MTGKYCVNCKHCAAFAGIYLCDAPQNVKAQSRCPVTGNQRTERHFDEHCSDLRKNAEACGPDGKWWEKRPPPQIVVIEEKHHGNSVRPLWNLWGRK